MKLWHADYSWEFPEGGTTLLSTSLAEAKRAAIENCANQMQEDRENAEKYGTTVGDGNTLTVTIGPAVVRKLDAKAVCEIINNNGCFWMAAGTREEPVLRITMTHKMKKPKVERIKQP
jgi:hypothetical protein